MRIALFVIMSYFLVSMVGCTSDSNDSGSSSSATSNWIAVGQPSIYTIEQFKYGFGGATTNLFFYGGKFFASDSSNNRILVWNAFPTADRQPADVAIGFSSTSIIQSSDLSGGSFRSPIGNVVGSHLATAEQNGNRVLIWNSVPTNPTQAANIVLGQPDMTSSTANNGGLSAQSMDSPQFVSGSNSKLVVSDMNNNRILLWSTFPTSNHQAADIVLGQPDMISNSAMPGGLSGSVFDDVVGVWSDGTRVVVADRANNRILIWNSFPTSDFQSADLVLGQPNLTTGTCNTGGLSSTSICGPTNVTYDGTHLIVGDGTNNRVLIWNSFPTANQQPADIVLGQPDMSTSNWPATDAASFFGMSGIASDGTHLAVSDYGRQRIMLWNSFPTSDGQPADLVLGKIDLTNDSTVVASASQMLGPGQSIMVGSKMVVADYYGNRVLIWNQKPTTSAAAADVVIGQPDMVSTDCNNGGISASTLCSPWGLATDGTRLFVVDYGNSRVLIWNSLPTTNFQPADRVLGQPDMISSAYNTGGMGAGTMALPYSVAVANNKILVADTGNYRVLIWDSLPTVDGQTANFVIGQPDMVTNNWYDSGSGLAANNFYSPYSVSTDGTHVVVADNNRVLIWNSIPSANGVAADVVLGQTDFLSDSTGTSATTFNDPEGVYTDGQKLFVTDGQNNRVLVWESIPTVNQQPADSVIGQSDFLSNTANSSNLGAGLNYPYLIFYDGEHIHITDYSNYRVVLVPY